MVMAFVIEPNYSYGWSLISHVYPGIDFWKLTPIQLDVLSDNAKDVIKGTM